MLRFRKPFRSLFCRESKSQHWVFGVRRRGDVVANVNGQRRILRLSLAALARVESCYGDMDILALVNNFATHGMTRKDADNIIRAALTGAKDSAAHAETIILGDKISSTELANQLIEQAFQAS